MPTEQPASSKRIFWSSRAVRFALVVSVLWCGYAVVPLAFERQPIHSDAVVDASFAFALSLLMALRINRAYERWWEARTLWGTLVNASRNLAVKVHVYVRPDGEEAKQVHALISAFAFGLRDHLRGGAKLSRLTGFEGSEDDPVHVPSYLVSQLNEHFREWVEAGRVSGDQLRMLDLEARILLEVCGACERIRSTPLPPALTWVTRVAIAVALITVPWLLHDEFGWVIIPAAGVATFLLLVSETIAHSLERAFGRELNQLKLSEISAEIDSSTAEILGVDR